MRRAALALALLAALSAAASALDCAALGFSGFALCSSCDALENAVHDAGATSCAARALLPPSLSFALAAAELAAECRQCCAADDSAEPAGPFDSAALEVCPWRLSMQTELREFADEAMALYGTRFRVKNRSGSPPTLVLSSKGVTPQRIRVDAWKKSAIADYLSTRLAAAPPPAPAVAAGEL